MTALAWHKRQGRGGTSQEDCRRILVVKNQGKMPLLPALRKAGFQVDCADSPRGVLERLREHETDLILLGASREGLAVLDLLRLLRAAWAPQQLPVIVMCDDPSGTVEMAALEAGANDCVSVSGSKARVLARVRAQIRQREEGNGERERAERVFRATAGTSDIVWEWNLATDRLWFSPEWNSLTGRRMSGKGGLSEWLGSVHGDDVESLWSALENLRETPGQSEFSHEYRIVCTNGEVRWMFCRARAERDRNGALLRLTGLQTDITRNKNIDCLTQLPNRDELLRRVDQQLGGRASAADCYSLFLINLDRFRLLTESLEPPAGDRLLREVACRLERAMGSALVARVQVDSFAVVVPGEEGEANHRIAELLHAAVAAPFRLDGREIRLSASIGIATLPTGVRGARAFDLLRDAESALGQAKAAGRGSTAFYDPAMRRERALRMDLEIDLRDALGRDEFELVYQPKIVLQTGMLRGFEALLRWRHSRLGIVSPASFISIAEETGLILPIGKWAIMTAAAQLHHWRKTPEGSGVQVSVNVSAKQFFDRDLVNIVAEAVRRYELPPNALFLEVTESVLIGDTELAAEILQQLNATGVGLMIDDFGTGYSSLNYLAQFPFHTLKIDRSFIERLQHAGRCAAVVNAVVTLAQTLQMDVVAEGVEHAEQADHLRRIGCEYAQGFLYSRPISAGSASSMIADRRTFH